MGLFLVLLPLVLSLKDLSNFEGSIWEELSKGRVLGSVWGSLLLAITTGLSGALIGVPAAYFLARYKLPFQKLWILAFILPLVVPSYISAYSYLAAFGKAGFYESLFHTPFPFELKGNLFGAWLSMTMVNFPFVFLMTYTALLNLPASLEESAMSLGSSKKDIFFKVILPNIKVPVFSGMLMVSLYSLSDFGTPTIMDYRTLTFEIFNYWDIGSRDRAAVFTILLIILAFFILLSESAINRRSFYLQKDKNCTPAKKSSLNFKHKSWIISFFSVVCFFSLIIPISTILFWAIKGSNTFKMNDATGQAIVGSTVLALLTALVAILIALPFAWYAVREKGYLSYIADKVAFMGNMVPGVVIAISLVAFFIHFEIGEWSMYNTLAMPIIGCAIRFLPQAVSAIKTSLVQISPSLEEASSSLGKKPSTTFRKITGPLLMPGTLAAFALVFITTIKELPITLMLSPPDSKYLTQIIWNYMDDAEYSRVAIPALFLLTISSLSLFFILKQNRRAVNE